MRFQLTPTHKRLAEYLLCGLANAEIAEELGLHEGTVKNAFKDMLDITGMDDRVGLAIWLHEHREKLGIDCPCKYGYQDGALLVVA
jgi:DNA-binding NarL/FixJ family response regulator